ncbi:MAG: metallophosphoesterase [bacterium]|nr:metallophosphoesterase [bacterium]
MKILIISDSHDNLQNLEKALKLAKQEKISALLHCGDIVSTKTLKFIAENFSGRIYAVFGNADNEKEKILKLSKSASRRIKIFPETAELKIGSIKIAANHYPIEAKKLAQSQNYDFVFYGHAHRPWVEIIGQTVLANPGPLDNSFPTPTCAVLNTKTKKLELKILK